LILKKVEFILIYRKILTFSQKIQEFRSNDQHSFKQYKGFQQGVETPVENSVINLRGRMNEAI